MDGSVIRVAREAAKLSQDELARRVTDRLKADLPTEEGVGVGRTLISRIETGTRSPSVDVLLAIAEVLDIDLNLLKAGSGDAGRPMSIADDDTVSTLDEVTRPISQVRDVTALEEDDFPTLVDPPSAP